MSRILGFPLSPLQWDQTKLPVTMAGLGIRSANDHAASAYSTSFLQSQHLTQQLLNLEVNSQQASLGHDVLFTLSTQLSEEITAESLAGLTQKMLSKRIDEANLSHFSNKIQESGEREVARSFLSPGRCMASMRSNPRLGLASPQPGVCRCSKVSPRDTSVQSTRNMPCLWKRQ